MVRSVEVSGEIVEHVPRDLLAQYVASVEESEIRCTICGGEELAGSSTPASLQLLFDPADPDAHGVVVAHSRCSPPRRWPVKDLRRRMQRWDADLRWVPMLLGDGTGGIVWEVSCRLVQSETGASRFEPIDAVVNSYLARGLSLVGRFPPEDASSMELLKGWRAHRVGDSVEVLDEAGIVILGDTERDAQKVGEWEQQSLGLLEGAGRSRGWIAVFAGVNLRLDGADVMVSLKAAAGGAQLTGARVTWV